MPNINVSWIPNISGSVTNQRINARLKGTSTWSTSNFVPANDLSTAANNSTYTAAINNYVYEFMLTNLCQGGVELSGDIGEGINFACFFTGVTALEENGFTLETVGLSDDVADVQYFVFQSDGTTLVTTSPVLIPVDGEVTHPFTGLVFGTTYKVSTRVSVPLTNNGVTTTVHNDYTDADCQVEIELNQGVNIVNCNMVEWENNFPADNQFRIQARATSAVVANTTIEVQYEAVRTDAPGTFTDTVNVTIPAGNTDSNIVLVPELVGSATANYIITSRCGTVLSGDAVVLPGCTCV